MELFSRLLKLARPSQIIIFIAVFFSLIAGILSIFQAREISIAINQVFLQGNGLAAISRIIVTVFIIIMLRAVFVWAGERSASIAGRRIKQSLRQRLYSHLCDVGPAYLKGEAGEAEARTGELVNLATEGMDAIEIYFSQYLPQIALAALMPLAILVFVFQADFLSGIVLLVTAPFLPTFMYLIGTVSEKLTHRQWLGLTRMSAYFLDVLQGLTTLKSLGRSRDQGQGIARVSEQYRRTTMDVLKVTFLSALVLELIATLSTAVVAVEVGLRLLYGKLAFEQAFFVLLLAPEFYLPLRTLGTRFHAGMAGAEAAKRIFTLLELPTPLNNRPQKSIGTLPFKQQGPPTITFKDVSYEYSNRHQALEHISFEAPAGKMTALVGESGAGKTTLTWLLMGFLQPKSGEIYADGKPLSEIPLEQWHSGLAWVSQHPYLFNDTITANIKLACPEATQAEVEQAARLAHADEFITRLPSGYATIIGERGTGLSAGQVQRIALARAFLKNAPLLILDEATSHLDPETDALLQESLSRLTRHRTVLIIAHHRSTIAKADQVVELKQGRVVKVNKNDHSSVTAPLQSSNLSIQKTPQIKSKMTDNANGAIHLEEKKIRRPPVEVRLIKLLAPFAGRILLSMFLGVATIASGVGLMATAAYIISAAALHPSIAELQVAIVGVRFFGLSRGIFRYLERLVSHDVTFRLLARWRLWFYQALEPLAPARLMQYHSGDLLSRIIADIGSLENFYVRSVLPPLVALFAATAIGVYIGSFGSELGWAWIGFLLLAGLALPVVVLLLSHRLGPQVIQARADLNKSIIDGIQGLADLLTCGQVKIHIAKVNRLGEHLVRYQARQSNLTALHTALSGLLANLCMLTVLVLAIQRVSQGQLAGVLLGVVALGALLSFEAVQPLPTTGANFETNRAAARRLYELVDASPAVNDPIDPHIPPADIALEVKDLSFQYPHWLDKESDATNFSLDGVSFSLPNGKHIAIVGPSGSGKTTLVNLLQRFWEYQQGSIQLGGNDMHQYLQEDIRQQLGTVTQNTYIFTATIKENLLIACPNATDIEIANAIQAAQLDKLIQTLPNGYHTWIGEHGQRLSAGECQRLAIARLVLKNAPLLILDEPTSNLDPLTEMAVMDSIRSLTHGRSALHITQHLAGLDRMDEILVLQDGRLVEHGSHEQLVNQQGLYARMWELYNQIL